MSRYDWLKQEIERVPRRKFFLSEPVPSLAIETFELQYGPLPEDYKEFLSVFGMLRLYREPARENYLASVRAPFIEDTENGITAVGIGWLFSNCVYYLYRNKTIIGNGSLYFGEYFPNRKSADSFEIWLKRACEKARKDITKAQWKEIMEPPAPFTERETAVIQAMELFEFRKVGVTADGLVRIEVQNRSSLVLPVLAIDVHWKNGRGGCRLPTAGIQPGGTGIVEVDLYKNLVDPHDVELVRRPRPEPEDRPYYIELNNLE